MPCIPRSLSRSFEGWRIGSGMSGEGFRSQSQRTRSRTCEGVRRPNLSQDCLRRITKTGELDEGKKL
jgi:hypothetical protein